MGALPEHPLQDRCPQGGCPPRAHSSLGYVLFGTLSSSLGGAIPPWGISFHWNIRPQACAVPPCPPTSDNKFLSQAAQLSNKLPSRVACLSNKPPIPTCPSKKLPSQASQLSGQLPSRAACPSNNSPSSARPSNKSPSRAASPPNGFQSRTVHPLDKFPSHTTGRSGRP